MERLRERTTYGGAKAMDRRESNYEITKHCMRARFAAHDMEAICREWQLARPDGRLTEPDYNVRMTLFDIFPLPVRFGGNGACQRPVADPDRHRRPGAAKPFGGRCEALSAACERLDAIRAHSPIARRRGPSAARLPRSGAAVQLRDADDEFSSQLILDQRGHSPAFHTNKRSRGSIIPDAARPDAAIQERIRFSCECL